MKKLWLIAVSFFVIVFVVVMLTWDADHRRASDKENGPNMSAVSEEVSIPESTQTNRDDSAPAEDTPSLPPSDSTVTAQKPKPKSYEFDEAEWEYAVNKEFEAAALEIFPVYTVQTHDPRHPEEFGPKKGEIWVRIKPEAALTYQDVMAETAELYRELTYRQGPVTVMHWVGNRPYAKLSFSGEYE